VSFHQSTFDNRQSMNHHIIHTKQLMTERRNPTYKHWWCWNELQWSRTRFASCSFYYPLIYFIVFITYKWRQDVFSHILPPPIPFPFDSRNRRHKFSARFWNMCHTVCLCQRRFMESNSVPETSTNGFVWLVDVFVYIRCFHCVFFLNLRIDLGFKGNCNASWEFWRHIK